MTVPPSAAASRGRPNKVPQTGGTTQQKRPGPLLGAESQSVSLAEPGAGSSRGQSAACLTQVLGAAGEPWRVATSPQPSRLYPGVVLSPCVAATLLPLTSHVVVAQGPAPRLKIFNHICKCLDFAIRHYSRAAGVRLWLSVGGPPGAHHHTSQVGAQIPLSPEICYFDT